ncbi:hypothetical protein KW790_02400 [Candidatus Parcubacteria bacterium]|nr:hypothetical protein [Candidatus Parcubacteria bacterium]
METSINYSYALSLLKRFNILVERTPALREKFIYKNWNLLQTYQANIFGDSKIWTKEENIRTLYPAKGFVLFLKTFVLSLAVISISFVSLIYILIFRKKILIFSGDKVDGTYSNDFRLETLYDVVFSYKIPFIEVIHTLSDRETVKHFIVRKRPVIFLETLDLLFAPIVELKKRSIKKLVDSIDTTEFTEEEAAFIKFELEKYISSTIITRIRLNFFKLFFSITGIKAVFSIDDVRHYNELMAAAKESRISSYAIQHGHFTKYHPGWLRETEMEQEVMRPEKLVVWSKYWSDVLLKLGTYFKPEELLIGGERWGLPVSTRKKDGHITILIPYEKDAPKLEVREYIERLLKIPHFRVVFKIRADQDKQSQLDEYGLAPFLNKIIVVRSMRDIHYDISVALGTYSTFLYDMVVEERPVAIIETSIDYGEGMVENGLANFIKKTDDLEKVIKALTNLSNDDLRARRDKLIGKEEKKLEKTLSDILKSYATSS